MLLAGFATPSSLYLFLVPVGATLADVGLHLGRPGTVRPRDVGFLFSLGLRLGLLLSRGLFRAAGKNYAAHDDLVDVVASETCHGGRE